MLRLRLRIVIVLIIAALVVLWARNRSAHGSPTVASRPAPVGQPIPASPGPPSPMAMANDRMPAAVEAKISRWSSAPSLVAVTELTTNSGQATKPPIPSADHMAPPPNPFPEPKKVLTPEEVESGKW